MNNFNLIGRIASDPIKKYIQQFGDKCVVNFTIAFHDRTRETDGKQLTHYIDCSAWDKVAERIAENCKKGSKIAISGHLEQQHWTSESGEKKSKHILVVSTIEYLDPRPKVDDNGEVQAEQENEEIEDNDLPF